jgi:shikimate dehydrogenase
MTITGKTLLSGIIGWPVAHSRSPQLHGYWLRKYGINGAMVPLAVRPDALADAVHGLAALGFRGANVTIPHKETVLGLMHEVAPLARRIGAVNTITVGDDGSLLGSNTDAFGFLAHLKASAPGWRANAGPVAVLGAGGAARAVIAALADDGVEEIRLINRTRDRADAVATHFEGAPITVMDWDDREEVLEDVTLLVNATSLGMTGKPPLDMRLSYLPRSAVVYDLVYAPLETPLLQKARAAGAPGIDGLGMLMHQARPAFKAWYGVDPEADEGLRALLIADLGL